MQVLLVIKMVYHLTQKVHSLPPGIRLGSPAGTSRGFKSEEFKIIGNLIGDVLDGLAQNPEDNFTVEQEVKIKKVKNLVKNFQYIVS